MSYMIGVSQLVKHRLILVGGWHYDARYERSCTRFLRRKDTYTLSVLFQGGASILFQKVGHIYVIPNMLISFHFICISCYNIFVIIRAYK